MGGCGRAAIVKTEEMRTLAISSRLASRDAEWSKRSGAYTRDTSITSLIHHIQHRIHTLGCPHRSHIRTCTTPAIAHFVAIFTHCELPTATSRSFGYTRLDRML
jgi:hypothetical protein